MNLLSKNYSQRLNSLGSWWKHDAKDVYLARTGRILWILCNPAEQIWQICSLHSGLLIFSVNEKQHSKQDWGSTEWRELKYLSSAWRSTPTTRGAETVERITVPNTATSFNSISKETLTGLHNHVTVSDLTRHQIKRIIAYKNSISFLNQSPPEDYWVLSFELKILSINRSYSPAFI